MLSSRGASCCTRLAPTPPRALGLDARSAHAHNGLLSDDDEYRISTRPPNARQTTRAASPSISEPMAHPRSHLSGVEGVVAAKEPQPADINPDPRHNRTPPPPPKTRLRPSSAYSTGDGKMELSNNPTALMPSDACSTGPTPSGSTPRRHRGPPRPATFGNGSAGQRTRPDQVRYAGHQPRVDGDSAALLAVRAAFFRSAITSMREDRPTGRFAAVRSRPGRRRTEEREPDRAQRRRSHPQTRPAVPEAGREPDG